MAARSIYTDSLAKTLEVHRFGFNLEQLSMEDRQLFEAKERIRVQKRIIEGLMVKGHDTASAECLLNKSDGNRKNI
jgi:hypothetical protein